MTDKQPNYRLYINDDLASVDLDEALAALSPQRREQAMRFKHRQGRLLSAVAYRLLCRGLREMYSINELPQLGYAEGGKPFIIGHEHIHFNLSHCRRAVACVLSSESIGVDIEEIGRGSQSLVNYTMNEAQCRQIAAATEPQTEFIKLWTMKESLLKLTGEGLRNDLRNLQLDGYRFATTVDEAKGYVCTVCQFGARDKGQRARE